MKTLETFDNAEIGRKVRQLRKSRGMRQDELGLILGDHSVDPPIPLSRGQVSNLETAKRRWNINQIKAVADYFKVDIHTLGIPNTKIEIPDLLARSRDIFENDDVPLEQKQELAEMIYSMYIEAKTQVKEK